ncbi:MAG: hypothetical protein IT289_00195 [Oligoflexia bacterium]|nr:hypothetical protein [Oligoflexia bacterium]
MKLFTILSAAVVAVSVNAFALQGQPAKGGLKLTVKDKAAEDAMRGYTIENSRPRGADGRVQESIQVRKQELSKELAKLDGTTRDLLSSTGLFDHANVDVLARLNLSENSQQLEAVKILANELRAAGLTGAAGLKEVKDGELRGKAGLYRAAAKRLAYARLADKATAAEIVADLKAKEAEYTAAGAQVLENFRRLLDRQGAIARDNPTISGNQDVLMLSSVRDILLVNHLEATGNQALVSANRREAVAKIDKGAVERIEAEATRLARSLREGRCSI